MTVQRTGLCLGIFVVLLEVFFSSVCSIVDTLSCCRRPLWSERVVAMVGSTWSEKMWLVLVKVTRLKLRFKVSKRNLVLFCLFVFYELRSVFHVTCHFYNVVTAVSEKYV